MSVQPRTEPQFDICWESYLPVGENVPCYLVGLQFMWPPTGDVSIHDMVADLYFDGEVADNRATWHRNYSGLACWLRGHILRLAMGWKEERLAEYFWENHEMATEYGFYREYTDVYPTAHPDAIRPRPPSQSRSWEIWNQDFPERTQEYCRKIVEELVNLARANGIPAPSTVFQPDSKKDSSKRTEDRLISDTTEEVWQEAKPFVTDNFYLKRGQNWQIHENAYFEQHTYMSGREDMYAESGYGSFLIDSTRERPPTGSAHRHQIGKLTVEEIRSMFRNTTKNLISHARRDSELVGKLMVAIDTTKGKEFTGDRDGHEDEILGYKDGKYYYQWAVIKIIGSDIPLILDAIPREKGQSKAEIVDELLENATDMIDDFNLTMMDREFDSEGVKDVCDKYDVPYLNPVRIFNGSDEAETIEWMNQNGKTVHVTEEKTDADTPSRKQIYLRVPSTSREEEDDNPSDAGTETNAEIRQEMLEKWRRDEESEADEVSPFGEFLVELHREEEKRGDVRKRRAIASSDTDEDGPTIVVYETNHPSVSVPDADGQQMDKKEVVHMVARIIHWYGHRWGIENGFDKLKKFMVRTTSKEQNYRFFNFMFAFVLYNIWRLVDLLVKLAIQGGYSTYAPYVDANRFLTVAKKYHGLDPP